MAHRNARLTPHGRRLLCERIEVQTGSSARRPLPPASAVRRRANGWRAGAPMARPACSTAPRGRCGSPCAWSVICCARWCSCAWPRRGPAWIAWRTHLAPATVYRFLRRHRLHRLRALETREPAVRYCWPHAGELVHLDTKKLGRIGVGGGKRFGGPRGSRGIGWDCVHVAVDDATRLAYAEELPDERGADGGRLPRARPRLLLEPGHQRATPAHRQRQPVPLTRLPERLRRPRAAPLAHPALPPADQWQGRGVREDRPERLGLQAPLRDHCGTHRCSARLSHLLQWLPTPWRSGRRHAARQAQVNNLVMQNS